MLVLAPAVSELSGVLADRQAAFINPIIYGNVAFIRRGGCNLVTKFSNALSKGARLSRFQRACFQGVRKAAPPVQRRRQPVV